MRKNRMSAFFSMFKLESKPKENDLFLKKITEIIGFTPSKIDFYREAFTHRAEQAKDKNGNNINFERLEFLGDAVLSTVIANHLFHEAPKKKEGYLTKMRSKIVSRKKLNQIGLNLNLTELLNSKVKHNLGVDINGDLFEALIGAIYLDKSYKATENFIFKHVVNPHVDLPTLEKTITSHKSLILEWAQKSKSILRFNTFEEKNAEEVTIFVSIIRMNDKVVAKGRGTSKKKAEEAASKRVYYQFQNQIQPQAFL